MTKTTYGLSAAALSIVLGAVATLCSLADKTYVHISVVKPELAHLVSEYVEARGFPDPMWARKDSHLLTRGAKEGVILWDGILGNIVAWSLFFFAVEVSILLVVHLLRAVMRRKPADPD